MFAKNFYYIENHSELLESSKKISEIRENIKNGDVYIAKNVVSKEKLFQIRQYLTRVGQSSLPNYKKIEVGCENFHRMNAWDARAYVQGCFHQFVFFPWNQDVFNLFSLMKEIYQVRNLINGISKDKFLGPIPEDGCIARIAFQFYPKGNGSLNKHQDPVDHHQLTVPILILSSKGKDFKTGGAYVEKADGQRIIIDDQADVGDVVYFNARTPHGVETIDPSATQDWISFEGRWMMLVAVNKLFDNESIANAVDLERKN